MIISMGESRTGQFSRQGRYKNNRSGSYKIKSVKGGSIPREIDSERLIFSSSFFFIFFFFLHHENKSFKKTGKHNENFFVFGSIFQYFLKM